MIKLLNFGRFVAFIATSTVADVLPERISGPAYAVADWIDPGDRYVPIVTPMLDAVDRALEDWGDDALAVAAEMIERGRPLAEEGPR